MKVQEALKSIELAEESGNLQDLIDALNLCKSALSEIDKYEPVAYIEPDSIGFGRLKFKDNHTYRFSPTSINHEKVWLYTSPIRKESTDWQYFDEAYKKATESSEPDDWMNAALMAQQVRRKQLDTSPQPQNVEKCEPVGYVSALPIKTPQTIRSDANDVFKYAVYTSPISKE